MIEFRSICLDPDITASYADLFTSCFPDTKRFSVPYLRWLYNHNPMGDPVGCDAWDGQLLAAHYVGVPLQVQLEGSPAKVLLSLNTATRPSHQGKGLFTTLAERTYERAAALGYAAVIGVANANSTPGFVRRLGFQLVEPLAARIGFGTLGVSCQPSLKSQLHTVWTAAALRWRCENPNNPVFLRQRESVVQLFARSAGPMHVYAELCRDRVDPGEVSESKRRLSPLRLYLGLEPGHSKPVSYADIPRRLRPSPLNFIYRPLNSSAPLVLNRGAIRFSFVDFDAF